MLIATMQFMRAGCAVQPGDASGRNYSYASCAFTVTRLCDCYCAAAAAAVAAAAAIASAAIIAIACVPASVWRLAVIVQLYCVLTVSLPSLVLCRHILLRAEQHRGLRSYRAAA